MLKTGNTGMRLKLALNILAFFIVSLVNGQMYVDIKSSNSTPGVGEKFQITYTLKLKMQGGTASISHNGINITKPNFENFVVVDEGTVNRGFSFGGFGADLEISNYAFILQPKKEGTFTIPPLNFLLNGENIESDSYTISVGKGDPNAKFEPKNANIFTRIEVSKKNVYKGEKVQVAFKIYSRYQRISLEDYDYDMIDGVWTEEIDPGPKGWDNEQKTINGNLYMVYTLKKEIIFPQRTGEITIPAFKIDARINQTIWNAGSLESITSNSAKIKVDPLPLNAPNSFESQVGTGYSFDVNYSTTELKVGEPIDLKIKIKGKGNLKQLENVPLDFPTDFQVYDPEIKESIKVSSSGVSGSKEFNYLIIPRHHGTFEIPALEFSYFDMDSKKYKTFSSDPQTITVHKGDGSTNNLTSNHHQEDVELLSTEIRHIEHETTLHSKGYFLFGSKFFYIILGAPGVLFLLLLIATRWKGKKVSESEKSRKNASKNASKRLAQAEQLLKENKDKAFFEELYRALYGYLSNKYGIPVSDLNKNRIELELNSRGMDSTSTHQLLEILNHCEMARFAPVSHTDAENILNRSQTLLKTLENHA